MEETIEQRTARLVGELMHTIGYPPMKNGSVTLHFDSQGICSKVSFDVTRNLRQAARVAGR